MPEELKTAISQFLAHEALRLSSRTVETYAQELTGAVAFALKHNLLQPPAGLSAAVIAALVRRSDTSGALPAASTFNHRLSVWRCFFRFATAHLRWPLDLTADLARRNERSHLKARRIVEPDELALMLQAARNHPEPLLAARDVAVVGLLFHTGLRVAELVRLNSIQVVELEGRHARLVGVLRKGSIVHDLPLNKDAVAYLRAWLDVRSTVHLSEGDDALFVSRKRQRISVRAVQHLVSRLARSAQLPVSVHPHLLRHSFASALLSAGAPLSAVQQLMAHSRLSTTEIYLHSNDQQARAAVELLTDLVRHESVQTPTSTGALSPSRPEGDIRHNRDAQESL